ncbi:hypothetical protein N431DRAFT_428031 [Stipitochalara longipes BDJ]|nr:hypothetical protein N431DRAFT_428031 [Stipitochalara longipes BDJ]
MGRDTNEKITDGVRGMYEKATGGGDNNGNLILCKLSILSGRTRSFDCIDLLRGV